MESKFLQDRLDMLDYQKKGFNALQVGVRNRLLVLKSIALNGPASRAELASKLGLTRTALGNIVSELIESRFVIEEEDQERHESSIGRRPILIRICDKSACIMGLLIRRDHVAGVLADLSGKILVKELVKYDGQLDTEKLTDCVMKVVETLRSQTESKIPAIGISTIGPIDAKKRMILNPQNFYGIHDVPICDILEEKAGIPCYVINDSNGGALAEEMYGNACNAGSFIYLHIENGIGSGFVMDHKLHSGDIGQSGEIGHSTIDYKGPLCGCGNVGCLELYANNINMNKKIRYMRNTFGGHGVLPEKVGNYSFSEILSAVEQGDTCAIAALDEFCGYLSATLSNLIKFLNVSRIVVGYKGNNGGGTLERVLEKSIRERILFSPDHELCIKKSSFGVEAPLYGSIALIAELIFEGKINLLV